MFLTAIAGILAGSGSPLPPDYEFDFTLSSTALPAGVTWSGGNRGTQFNASGDLVWSPHNYCPYSEDVGGTGWTTSASTASDANPGTLPPGVATAQLLTDDGASAPHYVWRTVSWARPNQPYHVEFYAHAGPAGTYSSDFITYRDPLADPTQALCAVDLTNGTFVPTPTGVTNQAIDDVGDGWYRVRFDVPDSDASPGSVQMIFYIGPTIGSRANDGSNVYIAGVNLSPAPTTSGYYVPTTASTPALGPRIAGGYGIWVEGDAAQYIANGRTLSGWGDTNSIIAPVTGAFGDGTWANSKGSSLITTGAGQKITLSPTISSAELTFSCRVKGVTVTDVVTFSPDAGTTKIPMTPYLLSGEWERFEYTWTGANPNLEIEIAANGQEIHIDNVMLAEEPFAGMDIPTEGTATDRTADVVTLTGLTNDTYNVTLTSARLDGTIETPIDAEETAQVVVSAGTYAFSWADFEAQDIREHRIVKKLVFRVAS